MAEVYLLPDETIASGTWTPVGAATNHAATDDPSGGDDDNTSYSQGSDTTWSDLIMGVGPMTDAVEITAVELQVRFNNAGGGANQEFDFGIRLGGVNYLKGAQFVVSAVYANDLKVWTANPATGGLFTKTQLDDVQIILRTQDGGAPPIDSVRVTSARLKVTYQPLSAEIEAERHRATARLRRYSEEIPTAVIRSMPEVLDNELMDNITIEHPAAPWEETLNGEPLGRLHSVRSIDFDPNTLAVELMGWDQRRFLCMAYDSGRTARGTSIDEQGVARMSAGGVFSTTRASNMWVADCESRLVVAKGTNQRGYDFVGTLADAAATRYGAALIESASTNLLKYSSAVEGSGAIGVGKIVATGAAGTFAEEASPAQALWDASVSGFAYKFTAGSPHSADKRATWPATASQAANTIVRFSIDYMNTGTVSADRLRWALQRAFDSWWWNDSTGAWQSGAVDNPLVLVATRSKDTRAKSKAINVGSNSTTLTLSLAALSGGTAARVDRVYHVQLENKAWPTSRMVTGAATYTRASQLDSWSSPAISATSGTFLGRFIPEFSAADVVAAGATITFFDIQWDSDNGLRCEYDGTDLKFTILENTNTSTASKAWTAVAGTELHLAARWTSEAGEEGVVWTHDVYIAGVKGTSATRAGDPVDSFHGTLYVGCDSGGHQANGHLFECEFVQTVLTDEEIAAEAA